MKDFDTFRLRGKPHSMKGHYADADVLKNLFSKAIPYIMKSLKRLCLRKLATWQFGLSKLAARHCRGRVTIKGHYHEIPEAAEVYLCLRGKGYMLMKTTGGRMPR